MDASNTFTLSADNNPGIGEPKVVRVYHLGKTPVDFLHAKDKAIVVGTGAVAGLAWSKSTEGTSASDWVAVFAKTKY